MAVVFNRNRVNTFADTPQASFNVALEGPAGPQGPQGPQGDKGLDGAQAPSNATPAMNGTAAAGASTLYARGDHVHPSDTSRYAVAGGTVTGNVNISKGQPTLSLYKPDNTTAANIVSYISPSATRWAMYLGAGGAADDFLLRRHDDAGASLGDMITCVRLTGQVRLNANIVSTSTITGTLTVAGGMGVGGDAYYGGNIALTKASPTVYLSRTDATTSAAVAGRAAGLNRWVMYLGGAGATDDFIIYRYDDAGAQAGSWGLRIYRATGDVNIPGTTASTTAATGALTVGGGVGVAGAVNIGGAATITGALTLKPAASVTPAVNGDMSFQLTSNTSLTIKVKGSDGVVRSASLTLA